MSLLKQVRLKFFQLTGQPVDPSVVQILDVLALIFPGTCFTVCPGDADIVNFCYSPFIYTTKQPQKNPRLLRKIRIFLFKIFLSPCKHRFPSKPYISGLLMLSQQ